MLVATASYSHEILTFIFPCPPLFPLFCRGRSPRPPVWPREKQVYIVRCSWSFLHEKKMKLRTRVSPSIKTNSICHVYWNTANSPSYGWSWTFQNLCLTLQTFIIYLKFVCLSQITLHLDRRDFYQIVKNKSIVERNITDSALPCSSMKSILHVGTSAAAVMLSSASQA